MATAQIATVPSPVGGLNAYDNLAAMPATDAIRMDNLVPTPYGCTFRRGYTEHANGLVGKVQSLVGLINVDGTFKMFASAGGKLHDITVPEAVTELLSGFTNDYWQHVNFANAAGTHLVMVNGADDGIWYSQTHGVQRLTLGDGVVQGTWKGVDPKKIIQLTVHQRRIWGVQKDSTLGWFLPADAVFGTANFFDFGPFFKRGGYLAGLATWSADLGEGSDDHLVAISSEGEAAVFAGLDVASPNGWHLKGVYHIGAPPAGRRFTTNVAGDLMLITRIGVVSMATVLTSTSVNVSSNTAYSKKVQYLLNTLLASVSELPGWEINFFPTVNLLYINIPSVYSGGSGQLVANYINGSWCTFSGMNALCWMYLDGRQYYGDPDGNVYEGWSADRDRVKRDGSGGVGILAACQQAYTNFQAPVAQKQVGLYRPIFMSSGLVGSFSQLTYDYRQTTLQYPSAASGQQPGSYWDIAEWGQDQWGGGTLTTKEWRTDLGLGTAVSLTVGLSVHREVTWVATDYTYKVGGPL